MKVSVIIPAYMAQDYLENAVRSASLRTEVSQIIIVEDGSTDNTLEVCLALARNDEKVKVYRHPDGVNRGASASRNLGIEQATETFIAFLDADDFYLPNRFARDAEILAQNNDLDGTYNGIKAHFITPLGEQRFSNAKMKPLTTLSNPVEPGELFDVLLGMSDKARGHIHLNGLTVRKTIFARTGLFDPSLRYGEDTDLILRIALKAKLAAGSLQTPVAMRGVHDTNQITHVRRLNRSKYAFWTKMYDWGTDNGMPQHALIECHKRALSWRTHQENFGFGLLFLLRLRKNHPDVWLSPRLFQRAVKGVFGDSLVTRAIVRTKSLI